MHVGACSGDDAPSSACFPDTEHQAPASSSDSAPLPGDEAPSSSSTAAPQQSPYTQAFLIVGPPRCQPELASTWEDFCRRQSSCHACMCRSHSCWAEMVWERWHSMPRRSSPRPSLALWRHAARNHQRSSASWRTSACACGWLTWRRGTLQQISASW